MIKYHDTDMQPLKVCLISLRSYPLFKKNSLDYFGGAEVQMSLIAKELAKDKRFKVSLITKTNSQKKQIKQKRVTIYKTTIVDFLQILKKVDADIYIERTANIKVWLVSWFCRVFNKKFVYMVAHDWDVSLSWLYFLGLKRADLIVAQTEKQKQTLNQSFKLNSLVMPSLTRPMTMKAKNCKRRLILWIGRADSWKGPLKFIQLAKKFPNEKWLMICRKGRNKRLFNQVKIEADKLSNLQLLTDVPIEKIGEFFNKAKFLVNTSEVEGFPNTFLQAGLTKTAVISDRVNPDNYLKKYQCGLTSLDQVGRLINQPKLARQMGQNHFEYVRKHHQANNINILKKALLSLC